MDEPVSVLHEKWLIEPHLRTHPLHELRIGGDAARRETDADGIAGGDVDESKGKQGDAEKDGDELQTSPEDGLVCHRCSIIL